MSPINSVSKLISIRTILLSVFLLLMIFPLVVITYITYKKENELFQKQMSHYLLQTVGQTQRALDANLSEIDRLTWTLLYEQSLDFLNGPLDSSFQLFEANQKFKNMVYSNLFRGRLEHIRAIYFITANHDVLSTENLFYSYDQVDRENYKIVLDQIENQPLKMNWFTDKKSIYRPKDGFETPVRASVTAARRLIDSNTAKLRGYLFVQFNDLFISEYLRNVQIGATGSLLVSDSSGDVIYQQDPQLPLTNKISQAINALPSQGQGLQTVDGKWLLAYDTSKISGWKMTAVVPIDELIGPNQKILRYLLIMSAIGALVSVIVSFLLATAISKPVINLARLMAFAAKDNLHVRETQGPIREISILQFSFNRMMDRIQYLIHENERQQKEKREALLQALQMQIHPHFLYNTLDMIYWMAKKHKADSISKLVTALGRFFRFTLNAGQEWTTLGKELEHVENYLQIQSYRYRDKLYYEIEMDPEVTNINVMPLILQPLIENALEHGISKSQDGGKVTIKAGRREDKVHIVISNTGRQIDLARVRLLLQPSASNATHVGLRNVQQRIQTAFGLEYGIEVAAGEDQGAVVTVTIPYRLSSYLENQEGA
ncbi:sensor histidine kinase [Paenibacillus planticolens]|uniref:HAMP domain-containing protein n=1 Tax=Paenibacillus planticolens TaxID=2654976 RepID=A0ABX1ZPA2_9BACL|nr:sensor histidine kinase [Paenibacillus planticolens]NOV01448.1 HAMP domain-containing protein [Paenibacillus planticolens]